MADTLTKKTRKTDTSVTAMDVARLAGVTQPTVSRVINKPDLVSADTQEKVRRAMAVLNYKPSAVARGLARRRNGVIGFVVFASHYNIDRMGLLTTGIGREVASAKYLLSLAPFSFPYPDTEQALHCPLVSQHSCDGLIVDLECAPDLQDVLSTLTVPYVMVNPSETYAHDAVYPDDRLAGQRAVEHLISKGHRRIAYIATLNPHPVSWEGRMQGYEMTMYRNNLKPVIKTLTPKGTPTSREEQTQDLANLLDPLLNEPDPPTALVTYDADFAVRLTWLAYDRHWRLPEKFSVVSCDTSQNLSRLSPRITAMNNQLDVIGSEAVRMLLKKIESPHTPQPSRYVKGELKIFESVKDLNGD